MTEVLWRTALVEEAAARAYAAETGVPLRVAKWLLLREVNAADVERFLAPEANKFLQPATFTDISLAVMRILDAIRKQQSIAVVGDYDVDGVTATTILASTFDAMNATYTCIIPHRIENGYGLSTELVDTAHARGCTLIITVDNGIQANQAIDYAAALGIDVVLTDHHEPGDTLPAAHAVVHWIRSSDPAATQVLSGAGVAWKLAEALLASDVVPPTAELAAWHRGLATLGALADIMPMRGETRTLVANGIRDLQRCQMPGWRALCARAGVQPETLQVEAVLWKLTPRLNAAGRMDSADVACALLQASEPGQAEVLATQLEQLNEMRKADTVHVTDEALQQSRALYGEQPTAIVVAGDWNLGVVGIVAARLCETFRCPAIVLSTGEANQLYRGSGRAPDGFPLHDAVAACAHCLHHFGGHASAIGCGLDAESLEAFRTAFTAAVEERKIAEVSDNPLAEDVLPLHEATLETITWMHKLAPFGPANPRPNFCIGPVDIVSVTPLKEGKHVRIRVKEGAHSEDIIWFSVQPDVFTWAPGMRMMGVVDLEENVWQGNRRPQLRMVCARLLPDALFRATFADVYRLLRARRKVTPSDCVKIAGGSSTADIDVILNTFVELGFAHFADSAYHVTEQVVPRDLRESRTYQTHLHRQFHRLDA